MLENKLRERFLQEKRIGAMKRSVVTGTSSLKGRSQVLDKIMSMISPIIHMPLKRFYFRAISFTHVVRERRLEISQSPAKKLKIMHKTSSLLIYDLS